MRVPTLVMRCCISYYSYIKPQRNRIWDKRGAGCISYYSYIKPQRSQYRYHQTGGCISYYSYIKPQHSFAVPGSISRCISYYSYIKPQLSTRWVIHPRVVYRTIPTSNHNYAALLALPYYVVYRTIPTSNHNPSIRTVAWKQLYIVLFLHQTTTHCALAHSDAGCISYYSYIKPQPLAPA